MDAHKGHSRTQGVDAEASGVPEPTASRFPGPEGPDAEASGVPGPEGPDAMAPRK
jgi:hypothetical protein